ncbi:MAG: M20/M25/M40 family metallo-hydrolase [Candidatus Bathyarchaeota archaeon]|jgi:acetylornithine deacetylase/succinyl-diaminopimelate desuccinylase-like protein|nr:M20/M25/M40 family metallo-hydrolase [Candidatus Bathyarchaeota archaeon A05DMB-3]MDH7607084.1 M20/M25/M40 family metallo-hydrolase [Candidatus Bathyarchaeota archaeon]
MGAKLLKEIEEEVTALLSDLIRINTTNPPGNETQAAKYLAETLEKEGFKCEVLESAPGRGNVITRLKGTGEKPSLLLLSHLDVVAANPKEWSVDPFSGLVKDGFVWGRGAMDMKSMTAMEVMVMKLLKRNNVKLKGDVILAATADEEKGGEYGAGWLVSNCPEKVMAEYVINEGGGQAIPVDEKNVFTIQTAEKGILWFKVKAKGRPGHGSVPGAADNAILRMNKVVEKLGNYRAEMTLTLTVTQFLNVMAEENELAKQALALLLQNPAVGDQILDMLAKRDKAMAEEIRAMLRMTIAPTIIHGGIKENIIPSDCEAIFDCRILPGQSTTEALNRIKELLQEADLEKLDFEIIQANEPSESPMETPLYGLMVETLKNFEPNCAVAPILLTGGTDSRFFRKKGAACYGFQPALSDLPYGEILKMVHGIDERISTQNLVFGTSVLYTVVEKFMT